MRSGSSVRRRLERRLRPRGVAKRCLDSLNVVVYLLDLLRSGRCSTLRQMYYVALNWIEQSQFQKQEQSNIMIEHIEAMTENLRESLGVMAEQRGHVFGNMRLKVMTRKGFKVIHCADDVPSSGLVIPPNPNQVELVDVDADFVLVVESGGMYARLHDEDFWHPDKMNCVLVQSLGVPTRATRMLCSTLSRYRRKKDGKLLPIVAFMDGDPWGYGITQVMRGGAAKTAHASRSLCVPSMIYIGLHSTQIEEFNLPTDALTAREKERIEQMLVDPRYSDQPEIRKELEHMRSTGRKAEQPIACKVRSNICNGPLPTTDPEEVWCHLRQPYTGVGLRASGLLGR